MKSFWRTCIKGFVTVIPFFISLYLVFWILVTAESLVYGMLKIILTDKLYIPGMGIAAAIVIFYMLGLMIEKQKLVRKLSDFTERQVKRIPVLKSLYSSLKSLMDFMTAVKEEEKLGKVVLVKVTGDIQLIGFVTGEAEEHLDFSPGENEKIVAVYIPMSYQVGGFTIYLPESRLTPLKMGFEEATQLILTAGIGKNKEESRKKI